MSLTSVLRASAVAAAMMIGSAQAATIDYSFPNSPLNPGNVIPNSLTKTVGGVTVTVTAWAATGANGTYERAGITTVPANQGLGVCNKTETGCYGVPGNMESPLGNVDNLGSNELLMFVFSKPVNILSAILDPHNVGGSPDRDASYWVGSFGDITGLTVADFGTATNVDNPNGSDAYTMTFAGSPYGTVLLLSASILEPFNDNFRVKGISVEYVPEPVTIGLLGASLLGLGVAARRRRS